MFQQPEVTITCRGVGGTGNVHMTPPNCWVTNLAITMIPNNSEKISREYLFWAMKSSNTHDLITGSAQHQITINSLSRHSLIVPHQNLIDRFTEQVVRLHQQKNVNNGQSETLQQLRDTLLPKLLSGEIRVKAAEQAVAAVA
jgi:type I restriction enzyme S subunit